MGAVHDDRRRELQHVRDVAKVHHKVVVAEGVPAFRKPDVLGSRITGLLHGVAHIHAAKELSLLDVYGAACLGGCYQQVSLTAEKGGNL